ncbi:hypothetical protein BBI17_006162, partial [Phytophthora kernoviae]
MAKEGFPPQEPVSWPNAHDEGVESAQEKSVPITESQNVASNHGVNSGSPMGMPPQSAQTSDVVGNAEDHPPHPASPVDKQDMSAPSIPSSNDLPVSLETLLVDFFTEVDKKRLNMAK